LQKQQTHDTSNWWRELSIAKCYKCYWNEENKTTQGVNAKQAMWTCEVPCCIPDVINNVTPRCTLGSSTLCKVVVSL
jgi:hypothetical protein